MWDSVIKNIGVLTAVATLVGSAIAFFIQRADVIQQTSLQLQINERESKKVFLDKQAELYFEVVPLVSKLANQDSPDAIEPQDENRFWHIFWGELGMVEDAGVARAMDLFGRSLDAFQGKKVNPTCARERKAISLMLSHCVRKSLGQSWGVDLVEDERLHRCTEKETGRLRRLCGAPGEEGASKAPKDRATR